MDSTRGISAPTDAVPDTVRGTIEQAGPHGRLWLGSSTKIHPACKLDRVLTMWDTILKHGHCDQPTGGRP